MSEVSISVLGDPDSSAGGAIIRLNGVGLVPPGSTFRIDPIDDEDAGSLPAGWPEGDLKPVNQRITKDGVDLIIGPEIVEAPALVPGTPVTITVASVGARSELQWPSLAVARAPRRAAVIKSGEQLAAELAERAEADRLAALKAVEEAAAAAQAAARAEAEAQAEALQQAARLAAEAAKSAGEQQDREVRHERALAAAREAASHRRLNGHAHPPAAVTEAALPISGGWEGASDQALSSLRPTASRMPASGRDRPVVPAPLKPMSPAGPAEARSINVQLPPPTLRPGPAIDPQPPAARPPGVAGKIVPFVLGAVTAGAMATGLMTFAWPSRPPAPPAAVPERLGDFAQPKLAEILRVPDVSPQGRQAASIDLDQALLLADRALQGPDIGSNRDEAKFWLRRALSQGLGDERLLWAMTQLGTLYARPGNEAPDYASAQLLWSLAAAKGDPIALCFLGSLAEHGLGTARNARQALALYEQAKERGGCRGVDEALERARRAAR